MLNSKFLTTVTRLRLVVQNYTRARKSYLILVIAADWLQLW